VIRAAVDEQETAELRAWLADELPADWFVEPVELHIDRDEILALGRIAPSPPGGTASGIAERIDRFRGETREIRARISAMAEDRYARRMSWGVRCEDAVQLFTTVAVPVTARLRMQERAVLDTLVASGVAQTRGDAVGWCIRAAAQSHEEWLGELRDAAATVRRMRGERGRGG
jgi:hypothetical protein